MPPAFTLAHDRNPYLGRVWGTNIFTVVTVICARRDEREYILVDREHSAKPRKGERVVHGIGETNSEGQRVRSR